MFSVDVLKVLLPSLMLILGKSGCLDPRSGEYDLFVADYDPSKWDVYRLSSKLSVAYKLSC